MTSHHHNNGFYHFSFLRDRKVHGVYLNTIDRYLSFYPQLRLDHSHNFYSILLFTGGNGSIKINDNIYTVQPFTLSLIAPGQTHSFDGIGNAEGNIFFFCEDFYVEEFSLIRLLNTFSHTSHMNGHQCNPCIALDESDFNSLLSVLRNIKNEYDLANPSSAIIIRSLLNVMLVKFSGFYEKQFGQTNKSDNLLIHTLSHLLDSNFISEQKIGFYLNALNISETQLNDLCNKHFNCGLKRILQNRLMQEARKLLVTTEMSVTEISYKLNFEDNSYFNKVFKSQIGLTPKRFRELHKKLI